MFVYPSGNRDPEVFEAPDRFDIHRKSPRILSFGQGTHRCLGSFMARMEGRMLFEEVLREFPDYEVLLDESERLRTESALLPRIREGFDFEVGGSVGFEVPLYFPF